MGGTLTAEQGRLKGERAALEAYAELATTAELERMLAFAKTETGDAARQRAELATAELLLRLDATIEAA